MSDAAKVVCAVVVRDGRVLIARRPDGKRLAGLWEFPGGKVEEDEEPAAALHRELQEELGCQVAITKVLSASRYAYDWGSIELIPYLCELAADSPDPIAHEHSALEWVSVEQLNLVALAPADKPVVAELLQHWPG